MAKTYFEYTGDGSRTVYPAAFTLGYLQQSDVYVYQGTDHTTQLDYTWQDSTTIELTTPITSGTTLRVRRIVNRSALQNDYQGGAVLEEDNLDNSFRQGLMIAEEIEDGFAGPAGNILAGPLDVTDNQINNVADGTAPQDAVTLRQLGAMSASGVIALEQPRQVGDGTTTVFTSPASGQTNALTTGFWVFLDGSKQKPTVDYTVNIATGNIEFNEAPEDNVLIDISYFQPRIVGNTEVALSLDDVGTGLSQVPRNSDLVAATIAQLRTIEPTVDGQQIDLLGHTLQGLGGGKFYYDASDTNSADNDGTIIVTAGDKRWKRSIGSKFLAEWFGVDKSLADNYAAIIQAYNAAESARYDALWLPTNGGELTITDTIPLKRGVALMGGSTFDDQSGTVLKRGDSMDVPVVATPKWFTPANPVESHYFVMAGITINGNKNNQTVLKEAIAFWGVFVGSLLDNVFILNNYGPAMSNEHSYDFKIGLMWMNGCTVGSRGVWEIDQTQVAAGPIGLIDVESLYIENPSIGLGQTPASVPSHRGEGIRVGNMGRLTIAALHQEACDVNLHVTHGISEIIAIGSRSTAFCGDPAKLHSDIYLTAGVSNLQLGPTKAFSPDATFNWLDMTAGVKATNTYPTVTRTTGRWGGCDLNSSTSDNKVTTGIRGIGNIEQRRLNVTSATYDKKFVSETNDNAYYYEKVAGAFQTIGARNGQLSEKDFSRLESYGNSGDRFTDFVPRVIVKQESSAVFDALYITAAGELRIRMGAGTFRVGLTAV